MIIIADKTMNNCRVLNGSDEVVSATIIVYDGAPRPRRGNGAEDNPSYEVAYSLYPIFAHASYSIKLFYNKIDCFYHT